MSEQEAFDDLSGKTLGQFEIVDELGRGGMATVYRARQISINRTVAIKVLPRSFLHSPDFYERFEREVDVIAHLEHPHILPIYDFGKTDGMPYIAMRFLGGGSLAEALRERLPDLAEIEKPISQIAQALDHAHEAGVVHRDLKPANILLDEQGNAYLSDFGLARVIDSNLTGTAILGTPAYMSPEQASGAPLDGRSDVYALGIVLFQMVTGQAPFTAETPMAVLLKHLQEPLPPLSEFREDVPYRVEDVILKATEKNPDDRYDTAGDMAQALHEALILEMGTAATIPTMRPPAPSEPDDAEVGEGAAVESALEAGEASPQRQPVNFMRAFGIPGAFIVVGLVVVFGLLFFDDTLFGDQIRVVEGEFAPVGPLRPTAFPGGQVIEDALFSLSLPEGWMSSEALGASDVEASLRAWQAEDGAAFASLIFLQNDAGTDADFQQALEAYDEAVYASNDLFALIDEAEAQDRTVRRSYRFSGNADFAAGQVDVFYQPGAGQVGVLALYTADSSGNELVPVLQLVLDSLRVGA